MAQFRDYLIAIKTGNVENATLSRACVYTTLNGVFGQTGKFRMSSQTNTSCSNIMSGATVLVPATPTRSDYFNQGSWDIFRIRTNEIGTILSMIVYKDNTDAWFMEKAVVIPMKGDGTYEIAAKKTFSPKRWFDSNAFDTLVEIEIHPDEEMQASKLVPVSQVKTAKTIVMRYDNSGQLDPISTTFNYRYEIMTGVAIRRDETKSTTTSVGVAVEVSWSGFFASGSRTTTFGQEIMSAVSNSFGATTTTTVERTQDIPVIVPANTARTLIVQVYQTAQKYDCIYGDYKVPVTVYQGNVDLQFKLFPGVLTAADATAKATAMAQVVGASIG